MDNLRNISIHRDEVATSFALHLYTNVSVKEAISEASEKLYSEKFALPLVDKGTFIILAKLATTVLTVSTSSTFIKYLVIKICSQYSRWC